MRKSAQLFYMISKCTLNRGSCNLLLPLCINSDQVKLCGSVTHFIALKLVKDFLK